MMINKENYEIYAIDFLENTLDKETRSEMIRFLNNHPGVKSELESMMKPVIMTADQAITFEPKSILKKEVNKKPIWVPTLLKYAAAIALLLSISTVFYLNNKINIIENTSETTTEKTDIPTESTKIDLSNKEDSAPISESKETEQTDTKPALPTNKAIRTPKPINTLIKELNVVEFNSNKNTKTSNIRTSQPINNKPNPVINNQISKAEKIEKQSNKRVALSIDPVELLAHANTELSNGSIRDGISIPAPPMITNTEELNKSKGSWLLNAITKKSDGTNIFAFEGVKRALTPTRLRDANVDKASSDSPLKQFTND